MNCRCLCRKSLILLTGLVLSFIPPAKAQDPLLETIRDPRTGTEVTIERLVEEMTSAEVIYLGEKHDNARQHEIQAELLEALIAQGVRPALGFEFFTIGQTSALMNYTQPSVPAIPLKTQNTGPSPEQRLRKALGWEDRSDEEWGYYFRLVEIARIHRLPVFATDLPWALSARITRVGLEGLHPTELFLVQDSGLNDEEYEILMLEEFTNSHCGYRNEELYGRMYQTWMARNDAMAQSIVASLENSPKQPVVMIVGFGHLQYGMGIPERVAYLRPETRQLNFAMLEVFPEPASLQSYLPEVEINGHTFTQDFDYLWFTARQDTEDPCQMFKNSKK